MSNQNAHKPGYKHTPLGWIPEEWEVKDIGEVCNIYVGRDLKRDNYSSVKTANHQFPVFSNTIEAEGLYGFYDIEEYKGESITIVGRGAGLGTAFMRTGSYGAIGRLLVLFPKNEIHAHYVTEFINSKLRIHKESSGIPQLTGEQIANYAIVLPTENEQRQIADILSIWDKAITQTQQLIVQLQQRNKGLMQALLTGKKRLKGFVSEWNLIHLSDAFTERNETGYVNLDLLSVGSMGVYPQSQSEKRDTSNADKSKYKRICPDDIGYNTMRMWQGRSALSQLEGIVSPAYTIVTPKTNQSSLFYSFLFKLPSIVHKFFRNSQGLVEDTLNCKFKDFAIVTVNVPEYNEQIAIADVLIRANEEIQLHKQKLSALQQQKKGLMQKLLTGEVRIKPN